MKIILGSDHAGFHMKEKIKKWLLKKKFDVVDVGALKLNPDDDYPDYAFKASIKVANWNSPGILFCGSAEGICIVANKVRGIRAIAPTTMIAAEDGRRHEDSNVLCLPGGEQKDKKSRFHLSEAKIKKIIMAWLSTPFSGEARHVRRLHKIELIEKGKFV
jgi:RpiB/LacA/LacB family sugar-phosphate isomerase